jgi:hypothetical protein
MRIGLTGQVCACAQAAMSSMTAHPVVRAAQKQIFEFIELLLRVKTGMVFPRMNPGTRILCPYARACPACDCAGPRIRAFWKGRARGLPPAFRRYSNRRFAFAAVSRHLLAWLHERKA